jgi:hypothetical protein
MTARELHDLHALLAQAVLVPSIDHATRADYEAARDLAAQLAGRLGTMSAAERERLALNADLPQLAFHLAEELRAGATAAGLAFMRRHVPRLLAEFRDHAHEGLDPLDAELALGLARLTRATYDQRFAGHYAAAGYRRPFVDKLYRDYALTGIPDGLLLALDALANGDDHDIVLCVLKGALPYVVLMELCGLPAGRVRYVTCGRATGSHIAPEYVVAPLGFDVHELAGRRVLVIDNNAATGATLAHLAGALPPARTTLFLDYVLQPLPALTTLFDTVICGPFGQRDDRAQGVRQRVAATLAGTGRQARTPALGGASVNRNASSVEG